MNGFPLAGHLKEMVALPSLVAFGALWPLIPSRVRGRMFSREGNIDRPVICLPGYGQNDSCFLLLARRLAAKGFGPISCLQYKPLLASIEFHAQRLARSVDRVLDRTGSRKVSLVGHSMGGIVARHYLQEQLGLDKVDKLVTVESPHQGLTLARYGPGECARQMDPLHPFMKKMREGLEQIAGLPILGIYSDVNPFSAKSTAYQLLDGRSDCFLPGHGHVSLLLMQPVAERIISFLHEVH